MVQAVIFDRDGVLLDSESANADSAIYAFSDLGILISEEDIKYIIGRHPEDYIKYFLEKYNFSYKDFRVRQSKKYHEIIELVPFFQNIIDLVKEIHSKNILVALTTSSSKENTFEMLEKMRLGGIFDVVVTREDCTYKKPNPEPYIITANKLNVDPQDCLVFEDTNVGVEAAKEAGMKCIAMPNKFTINQDFSRADLVIKFGDKVDINVLNRF